MEIRHLIQLRNASVIDISEAKLDVPILNIEIVIEDYDLTRLDCSRKGDGVASNLLLPTVANPTDVFLRRCIYQSQHYL